MAIEKMPFGSRLKLRRAAAGLTQRECADLLGVSLSQYRFYEYNRTEMPVTRFERFLRLTERFCEIEQRRAEERRRAREERA